MNLDEQLQADLAIFDLEAVMPKVACLRLCPSASAKLDGSACNVVWLGLLSAPPPGKLSASTVVKASSSGSIEAASSSISACRAACMTGLHCSCISVQLSGVCDDTLYLSIQAAAASQTHAAAFCILQGCLQEIQALLAHGRCCATAETLPRCSLLAQALPSTPLHLG